MVSGLIEEGRMYAHEGLGGGPTSDGMPHSMYMIIPSFASHWPILAILSMFVLLDRCFCVCCQYVNDNRFVLLANMYF